MKIAKEKDKVQISLVNPFIKLLRQYEEIIKIGEYIAIKCHYTLVTMTLYPTRLTSHIMEEDHLKIGSSGKTNFSRP